MPTARGSAWEMLVFVTTYYAACLLHEAVHVATACLVGQARSALTLANLRSAVLSRHVRVPGVSGWRAELVRHGGWIGSSLLAMASSLLQVQTSVQTAAWLTAIDAVCSDLLELEGPMCHHCRDMFRCGNFGVIIMNPERRKSAFEILRTMVRITMMRGAQSGGVVTYVPSGRGAKGLTGIRSRVVNGKRTDLSDLVVNKAKNDQFWSSMKYGQPQGTHFFAGHTRFATSSIASLDGTHPHQWTPPSVHDYFQRNIDGSFEKLQRTVEVFICHNGDLDFFNVGGVTYPLDDVMAWIERATHSPCPSKVDSAGVAGIMDLVRTSGVWYHSVRFGFLFGPPRTSLNYTMPTQSEFREAANVAQQAFEEILLSCRGQEAEKIRDATKDKFLTVFSSKRMLGMDMEKGDLVRFVSSSVDAFFDQDLLAGVRFFLGNAKGSFGLCITCSLDSHRQLVVAARGQTISVSFYPNSGLVLWGSEQAAVKAALVGESHTPNESCVSHECMRCGYTGAGHEDDGACRLDLDDLGGEIVLLDWGQGVPTHSKKNTELEKHTMMNGLMTVTVCEESGGKNGAFKKRLLRLHQNPLIKPLPPCPKDPVGQDVADIPKVLSDIQEDWDEGRSINNISAWWLGRCVAKRLRNYQEGKHDGSVDILVTGCEVSLWMGEQFCSDLTQVFPRLKIKCISANKLLGLFGQDFPIPQAGHQFHEHSWNMKNTITIIISHSGGTFSSLAVSNLMQAYTETIFVVASESDTQIGKQLRQIHKHNLWDLKCPVFTTEVGIRPAEPCSVSVAATHQILTQILLYLMRKVQLDDLEEASGGKYSVSDYKELDHLNKSNITALEEIVGYNRHGDKEPTQTEKELRDKGNYWALHVLETPMSWMLCATYLLCTVISGYPLFNGLAKMLLKMMKKEHEFGQPWQWNYILNTLDAILYLFMPQISVLILRVFTRRKLLHRMVGRSIVIGDIPWVAQSIEAYVSKLFACSYSAAGVAVYSGNPTDHLVHRMTHRVVRGGLVACGRPDGRLMALTSAEASVCLSVSQASSIQSIGSTCESLTIGHNPAPLGLAAHNIFLPGCRKNFMCEEILVRSNGEKVLKGTGAGALLGAYANMKKMFGRKKAAMDRSGSGRGMDRSGGGGKVQAELGFSKGVARTPSNDSDLWSNYQDSSIGGTTNNDLSVHNDTSTHSLGPELDDHFLETLHMMQDSQPLKVKKSVKDLKNYYGKQASHRHNVTLDQKFYGDHLEREMKHIPLARLCEEQMGKRVADFWPAVSFGYLGYSTSRTHSIMRIATTASPVSGAEVRDRTMELAKIKRLKNSKNKLLSCIYKRREAEALKAEKVKEEQKLEEERQKLLSVLSPEQRKALGLEDGPKSSQALKSVIKTSSPQSHDKSRQSESSMQPDRHLQASSVGHEGVVHKRGQVNNAFQKRYFVLSAGVLRYYKSYEDYNTQAPEKGSLQCKGMSVYFDRHHTGFEFILTDAGGKRVVCKVDTHGDREVWVDKLKAAALEAQGDQQSPAFLPSPGPTNGHHNHGYFREASGPAPATLQTGHPESTVESGRVLLPSDSVQATKQPAVIAPSLARLSGDVNSSEPLPVHHVTPDLQRLSEKLKRRTMSQKSDMSHFV